MTRDAGKTWVCLVCPSSVSTSCFCQHLIEEWWHDTQSESILVLSTNATVTPTPGGGVPVETIAGRFFPEVNAGRGGMVLITDGGPGWCLHAYISVAPDDMEHFVAAKQPCLTTHPPNGGSSGNWAEIQMAFVPSSNGSIASVGYALWSSTIATARDDYKRHIKVGTAEPVHVDRRALGYTMTVYDAHVEE